MGGGSLTLQTVEAALKNVAFYIANGNESSMKTSDAMAVARLLLAVRGRDDALSYALAQAYEGQAHWPLIVTALRRLLCVRSEARSQHVYRSAHVMITHHGRDGATAEAMRRAALVLHDPTASTEWIEVAEAVEELTQAERRTTERLQ